MSSGVKFGFRYKFELRSPNGAAEEWVSDNLIPNAGLDYLMAILFGGVVHPNDWYIGLLNTNYGPAAATHTMSDVSPYEVNTLYDGAPDRFLWTPSVSGGVVTNTATVNFVFNQDAAVGHVFLTTGGSRGSSAGELISVAPILPTALALTEGSELRVTATLTAQST